MCGNPGSGKTTLAIHAAHLLAERFPDGQLYVDLRGFDPGGQMVTAADAVRDFLDALSVPPERLPAGDAAQLNLYRSLLADRRILVLLDNARDAEHARPLVPGTPGSLVLVTSRDRLTSLVARDGAHPFALDLLSNDEARQLLVSRIGGERVLEEADAVGRIVAQCARLPLALSVVAARASADPARSLAALADGLRKLPGGLDMLDTADPATGIRQALFWSYRQLTGDAASLFRRLALHPGPDLSPTAAAGLAGMAERRARAALAELADAHLVEEHGPARIWFHDLLRAYASELSTQLDPARERRAATRRMLDHYLHNGHRAALLLEPNRQPITLAPADAGMVADPLADKASAAHWFVTERRVLLGLIELAANERFDVHSWQLAWALTDFLHRAGHWHEWARSYEIAIEAAGRLDDKPALALLYRNMCLALVRLDRHDEAIRACRRSLALQRELGDPVGRAHVHLNLGGIAMTLAARASDDVERRSRQRTALRHANRAVDLFRSAGNRFGTAKALSDVGWAYTQIGEHRQAIVVCEQALTLLEEIGGHHAQATTWDSIGHAHAHLDENAEAVACYQRALELFAEAGDRAGTAETLTHLGETHHRAGDTGAARDAWGRALAILVDLGDPSADSLRARLARLSNPDAATGTHGNAQRPTIL